MPRPSRGAQMLRALILACLVTAAAASPARAADPVVDLENATAASLQAEMGGGRLTSEQLTRAYVNRIAALNKRGPGLNAVRSLNPASLADAKVLDLERAKGQVRGPLHGIPVLLKDNIDVAGIPTTAGSGALENSVPDKDAPMVARLRQAGAVILGKTNLSVFANFFGASMPAGWSPLGGQVLNAYDTDLSPSGSSSGSGSAAASGLAALTIGTETSGSIISPAAAQGVVGLRPTVGLVSRTGILPISATQDTAGPMTRTVADAAAELQAMAGKDPEDDATDGQPDQVPDYASALKEDALQGARIGVVDAGATNGVRNNPQYDAAREAIRTAGATLVELTVASPAQPPSITPFEFKRDVNAYLARLPRSAPRDSLQDILDYANANPEEELKFGAARAEEAQGLEPNAQYEADKAEGQRVTRGYIDDLLDRNTDDPGDDLAAVMTPSGTLTGTGARAGYPQLTVPAGYTTTQRRPVGISFNGTAYSERTLLALGHAYEQATKLREPPSRINPAMYRCAKTTPPSSIPAHSCAPGGELLALVGEEPELPFSLETTRIDDLQRRMRRNTLSAETLTKAYLARIARTNTEGPSINAVRIVNPQALDDARALDAERRAGAVRGPMHGIPVLVKDNIDVRGLPTTAGAVALENSFPADDSALTKKLRAAGAIILGKTNLSEFANFYSSNSVSGYSGLGGQVLTPIDLDVNPSGSSSGSASAASAGLAAATIGSETSGSIVSPATANGVVGLRPTVGLVSRTGIIPISESQDTAGPITQTVYDAAAELAAIAGKDADDDATDEQPAAVPDYLAGLTEDALDGKRIATLPAPADTTANAPIRAVYAAAKQAMIDEGATLVEVATPAGTTAGSILAYEFKRDLNRYFARLPGNAPIKSLAQVIEFNTANALEAIRLGQSLLVESEAIDTDDPATRTRYQADRDRGETESRAAINGVLDGTDPADASDDFDAILGPSGQIVGLGARAGYPQITVPAGYNTTNQNPINVNLASGAYSEAELLAIAYAFEQATQARKAPSETNPGTWRCVPGSAFAPRSCAPGEFIDPPKDPVTDVTPGTDTTPSTTATPAGTAPTTPAPTAPKPAATSPVRPTIGKTSVRAKRDRTVALRIRCAPSAGSRCRGVVQVKSGKRVLARRSVSVPANRTTSVRVRLSRTGFRSLQRRKRLRVTVSLATRNAQGTLRRASQRITVLAP